MSHHHQHHGPPRNRPQPPQQQHGGSGPAQVTTNCFEVTQLPAKTFHMYDVSFNPDIPKDSWRKRTELVHHLRVNVAPQAFHPLFLYDGGAIGFAHPITMGQLGASCSFRVRLRDDTVPPADARNVTVIEFKRTVGQPITPTEINEVVVRGQDSPRRSSLLNFMQLVVRHSFNNTHPNNGRAYFPPQASLGSNKSFLELRKGIFHSVRPAIGRVLVVVDTTVAAFYRSGWLIDAALTVLKQTDIKSLELGGSTPKERANRTLNMLKKALRGVFIREDKGSRPGPRRSIKGFHRDGALYMFENSEGTEITIQKHYENVHNIRLKHPRIVSVILREGDRPEIVPMERCKIEPDQLYRRALPDDVTREMVSAATLKPQQKLQTITGAAGEYGRSDGLYHAEMTVKNQPMTVNAAVLPTPTIRYRNGEVNVSKGQWNLLGRKFFQGPPNPDANSGCYWAVLNLAPMTYREVPRLVRELTNCAENLGLKLHPPSADISANGAGGPAALRDKLNQLMGSVERTLTNEEFVKMMRSRNFFILCILETEATEARATLKNWGDVLHGVLTQCVRVNKLAFRSPNAASQYFNNVALKLNARLGGENSRIQGPRTYQYLTVQDCPTMIAGADVSHPSPGIRKPSVASLVYNHDQFATKYTAITRLQDPRQEVITDLKDMMKRAMWDLMGESKRPLRNIVFYRDGVSEGEYEKIRAVEIGAINEAIDELWAERENLFGAPKPKLSFVVVGKRHHTLMFPASRVVDDEKTGNCKAGVVVNSGITQPTIRDFFLLSHSAIIGTSRSSHYIILQDDVFGNQGTDAIQELSFALCHNYAKATRSVSIPAPVYYADLACGRDTFHFDPDALASLRGSDAGSVASGEAPFNLDSWKAQFRDYQPHSRRGMMFL